MWKQTRVVRIEVENELWNARVVGIATMGQESEATAVVQEWGSLTRDWSMWDLLMRAYRS